MEAIRSLTPVARYKQARKSEGKAQVLVWLKTDLRDLVDQQMAAEGHKNRSEAIESVIQRAINMKGIGA